MYIIAVSNSFFACIFLSCVCYSELLCFVFRENVCHSSPNLEKLDLT